MLSTDNLLLILFKKGLLMFNKFKSFLVFFGDLDKTILIVLGSRFSSRRFTTPLKMVLL